MDLGGRWQVREDLEMSGEMLVLVHEVLKLQPQKHVLLITPKVRTVHVLLTGNHRNRQTMKFHREIRREHESTLDIHNGTDE